MFQNVFAAVPQLASCNLDGALQTKTFNPNGGTISIDIFSDQNVKFNTIAICALGDDTCSRSTSLKYFTNTSSYLQTINKVWDGKTGGSDPTLVSAGAYKIRATLANQAGEINTPGDYCSANIIVDYSSQNTGNEENNNSTSTENNINGQSDNVASSTATTTVTSSNTIVYRTVTRYLSTHSGEEDLNDYSGPSSAFEATAGRERLSYINTAVAFSAKHKHLKNGPSYSEKFIWSFGDGTVAEGENVSHVYKYAGDYNVVLNASCGEDNSVSRTMTKIFKPNLSISKTEDYSIAIENNGNNEINLNNWKMISSGQEYIFPIDTIIGVGNNIVFSKDYTKISSENTDVLLLDPSGKTILRLDAVIEPNIISTLTNGIRPAVSLLNNTEVGSFVDNYKKVVGSLGAVDFVFATKQNPPPVTPKIEVSHIQNNKIIPDNKIPLTATVVDVYENDSTSTNQESDYKNKIPIASFWDKIIYPFRWIQKTFYK